MAKLKPTAKPKPSSKPTHRPNVAPVQGDARGEMRQLAEIRASFPSLSAQLAAGLLAQHDDASCRERGTTTRAPQTFKAAMVWARTVGAHAGDPALSPVRVRWFLDCLTALGNLLTGRSVAANPTEGSAIDDAEHTAAALLRRVERGVSNAAGTHKTWAAAVAAAWVPDPELDPRVSRLRQLSALLSAWLKAPATSPPLSAFDLDEFTVQALDAAVMAFDAAIASRPPPQQIDRDGPAVNAAEGRLYFIMRVLWDDLAEARKAGTSSLMLTVTPTLLRGLDLNTRKKPKGGPETPKPR